METQTIERTDTDERVDDGTDSDTPKYFHYVKKDKIAESAVTGTHVVALCGEVFPVTMAAAVAGSSAGLLPLSDSAFSSSHHRNRLAWVTGAGHSSSIAAFNSAPSMIANPRKKANNRNAIGVASAP